MVSTHWIMDILVLQLHHRRTKTKQDKPINHPTIKKINSTIINSGENQSTDLN